MRAYDLKSVPLCDVHAVLAAPFQLLRAKDINDSATRVDYATIIERGPNGIHRDPACAHPSFGMLRQAKSRYFIGDDVLVFWTRRPPAGALVNFWCDHFFLC